MKSGTAAGCCSLSLLHGCPLPSPSKGTQASGLLSPCSHCHWWAETQGPALEPFSAWGGQQPEGFGDVEGTSCVVRVTLQSAVWIWGGGGMLWGPMLRGAKWMEDLHVLGRDWLRGRGLQGFHAPQGTVWMDGVLQCPVSWGVKRPGRGLSGWKSPQDIPCLGGGGGAKEPQRVSCLKVGCVDGEPPGCPMPRRCPVPGERIWIVEGGRLNGGAPQMPYSWVGLCGWGTPGRRVIMSWESMWMGTYAGCPVPRNTPSSVDGGGGVSTVPCVPVGVVWTGGGWGGGVPKMPSPWGCPVP